MYNLHSRVFREIIVCHDDGETSYYSVHVFLFTVQLKEKQMVKNVGRYLRYWGSEKINVTIRNTVANKKESVYLRQENYDEFECLPNVLSKQKTTNYNYKEL